MIVKQDKKNKKLRKKMAKQEKEKANTKVSIFKKIKNKIIKKKSAIEKEASLGDIGESVLSRFNEEALTLSMLRKNQKF